MSSKSNIDLVNLGVLIVTGLGMLGSFWAFCESHYSLASVTDQQIQALSKRLEDQHEQNNETKAEIDALYLKMIPEPERQPLKFQKYNP